jgi:hypothetical protein
MRFRERDIITAAGLFALLFLLAEGILLIAGMDSEVEFRETGPRQSEALWHLFSRHR